MTDEEWGFYGAVHVLKHAGWLDNACHVVSDYEKDPQKKEEILSYLRNLQQRIHEEAKQKFFKDVGRRESYLKNKELQEERLTQIKNKPQVYKF